MAIRTLNQSFDCLGEWYLPDNPTRRIAGRLLYTHEGIDLHLNESFRSLEGPIGVDDNRPSYAVVFGTTTDGDAVTLLKAYTTRTSVVSRPGLVRESEQLMSQLLLVGGHIRPDFAYPEISYRIPALQVWLSREIIEWAPNMSPGRRAQSYRVLPPDIDVTAIPSIDATLEWGITFDSKSDLFTSIAVEVSAWVIVRPSSPKTLEWYFEQQGKIAAMLAFLAGVPMSPDCIEASTGHQDQKVSILFGMQDASYCHYKRPGEFFMPREAMGVTLNEVAARWFETYPKVHMPSQLALSVLGSEKLWLHVEFLSLMQALEGFHRGLFDGNYIEESEYALVKKVLGDAIPSSLAPDHQDALRSRIRYGNQISLNKRLDSLLGRLSESTRRIIVGGNGDVPRSWIDTRHYYTHWDEELRPSVLGSQAMFDANARMRHLLRALYLDLMGIPQESITKSLNNTSDTSQHLAQLNARERRHVDPNDTSGVLMTVTKMRVGDVNKPKPSTDRGPTER